MDWVSIVLLSLFATEANGTHLRGVMLYWKQSSVDKTMIDLDYRQAWRRDWKTFIPICDSNEINRGLLLDNGWDLDIFSEGIRGNRSFPFTFQCTDFSIRENWVSGKGRLQFRPSAIDGSSSIFYANFKKCCWILSIIDMIPNSAWSVLVSINTTARSDTGEMNKSPRVDMAPIVRLQYGCNHVIKIPASDEDGDDVRCRWARNDGGYKDECGGACRTFTHATIDERACTISYGANYKRGWYAVTVQIEDFTSVTSTAALSSVPLQFLVSVEQQSSNCAAYQKEKPKFIGLTLPDSACVGVNSGQDFTTDIYIDSQTHSSITELNTVSPIGLIKSSLQRVNASGTWHISVTWNPNRTDTVNNVFCFTAVDNNGLSSEQRCITLLAGVPPAGVVPSSKSPSTAVVPTTQRRWSIDFDQFAQPASRPAYIYLHLANGTLVETVNVYNSPDVTYSNGTHGTVLTFHTKTTLQGGQEYYLLLGQGLVQGHSYCGAESAAMLNTYFWRFTVSSKFAEVQCTASNWMVDIDMEKLQNSYPGSVATDIYMGDNSCRGQLVGKHLLFNYGIHSCLTSQSTTNEHLVFTNELVYAFHDPAQPFIIRNYNWTLDITCLVLRNESAHSAVSYNQSTSVDATVNPIGGYQMKLKLFTDPNFLNAIPDGPITVPLGSDVYAKAYLPSADWTVIMRLNSCYTSPSGGGGSSAYYIIKDGCEVDVNTHIISQAAHETRFVFAMFEMSANHGGLHLDCGAVYCDTSGDPASLAPCRQPCRPVG